MSHPRSAQHKTRQAQRPGGLRQVTRVFRRPVKVSKFLDFSPCWTNISADGRWVYLRQL